MTTNITLTAKVSLRLGKVYLTQELLTNRDYDNI